jgi:YbgC/YbaW family acyl-CoA thioester hydrolase
MFLLFASITKTPIFRAMFITPPISNSSSGRAPNSCVGIHHSELAGQGIAFAVRSMSIDFIAPAHIDDMLSVITEPVSASGARMVLRQTILRDDVLLTKADLTVVSIKTSGGPARLPTALRAMCDAQR